MKNNFKDPRKITKGCNKIRQMDVSLGRDCFKWLWMQPGLTRWDKYIRLVD